MLTFDTNDQIEYDPISVLYGNDVSALSDASGSYLKGNGFTPNIGISYASVGDTNHLDFWDTGYGDLTNVAYAHQNGDFAAITLTPQSGYSVVLNSFDLAGYGSITGQTVEVLDGNGNALISYGPVSIPSTGHITFAPALTASGPLTIQFGSSWYAGIDNINFDQTPAAVPETSTVVSFGLMLTLGLAAAAKRRKRSA